MIKKYKVLDAYTPETLNDAVNHFIEKGWQPYGELKVLDCGTGFLYIQAVVIYEE